MRYDFSMLLKLKKNKFKMSVKVFFNIVLIYYLINKSSSTNVSDNLLYNLAKLNFENLTITDYCRDDLETVSNGINNKEIWALKCKKVL